MQRRRLLVLLGLGLFTSGARAQPRQAALRIVVQTDVYNDYLRFLDRRNPFTLKNYGGPHSRRDVVEIVLLQQALQHGGETRPLRFILIDSTRRMLKMLDNNEADISGSSLWKTNADSDAAHLAISRPLIGEGAFMAGIYFPADHPGREQVRRHPSRIAEFTAVCASAWASDLVTLKALGSPVLLTDNWASMLGMLKKKRADFVLAPFQPTADFSLEAGDMQLKPVQGIKVSLAGSRHFLLNRNAPHAESLEKALNNGLQALEKEGLLRQAYRESGFEDVRIQGWLRLNQAKAP